MSDNAPDGHVSVADIEKAASELGWSADKGELSAFEFLTTGSQRVKDNLVGKLNSREDDIASLNERLTAIDQDNSKMAALLAERFHKQDVAAVEEKKATIRANIAEATEAGETERVVQLVDDLDSIEEPEPLPEPQTADQRYFAEWMGDPRNAWMQEPDLMPVAQNMLNGFLARDGAPNARAHLAELERSMRAMHPDRDPNNNPDNPNRQNGAGTGRRTENRNSQTDDDAMPPGYEDVDMSEFGLSKETIKKVKEHLREQNQ